MPLARRCFVQLSDYPETVQNAPCPCPQMLRHPLGRQVSTLLCVRCNRAHPHSKLAPLESAESGAGYYGVSNCTVRYHQLLLALTRLLTNKEPTK